MRQMDHIYQFIDEGALLGEVDPASAVGRWWLKASPDSFRANSV
jgi:hypothetical protein